MCSFDTTVEDIDKFAQPIEKTVELADQGINRELSP
jgi:hypothetical protein